MFSSTVSVWNKGWKKKRRKVEVEIGDLPVLFSNVEEALWHDEQQISPTKNNHLRSRFADLDIFWNSQIFDKVALLRAIDEFQSSVTTI